MSSRERKGRIYFNGKKEYLIDMYFGAIIGGDGNVMEGCACLVDLAHAQGINEM